MIGYDYFEQARPMVFTEEQSYVESDVTLAASTTHQWNHGQRLPLTYTLQAVKPRERRGPD